MLDIALLIITLTAGGEQRLSLTETTSLEACEQNRNTILGVLKQRNTKVLEARCAANTLGLTPYAHGTVDENYQHQYRVTLLPAEGYQLDYLGSKSSCEEQVTTASRTLCVVASQKPLS